MLRLLALSFGCIVALLVVAQVLSVFPVGSEADEVSGSAQTAAKARSGGNDDTEVERDSSGRFRLAAVINGQDADFLIDTGADVVALSVASAEQLGIAIDPEAFEPIAETASGTGMGTQISIDRLEIAGQEYRDVDAIVIEGLNQNLLGQSMLRRMGKMEMQGEKMIFRRS